MNPCLFSVNFLFNVYIFLADDEITTETCLLRAIGVKCLTTGSFTILVLSQLLHNVFTSVLEVAQMLSGLSISLYQLQLYVRKIGSIVKSV